MKGGLRFPFEEELRVVAVRVRDHPSYHCIQSAVYERTIHVTEYDEMKQFLMNKFVIEHSLS